MLKFISSVCSVVLAVGLSPVFAQGPAPANPAAGKVKISVLRPGDENKVKSFLGPAVTKFNTLNPDIEVTPVYESWGGWIQKYPTLFQADTQPDVIFWWDNKQNDASAKPRLVPLEAYLDASTLKSIPDSIWSLVSIGGTSKYYVPSSVDPFVLYYNKNVFKQAGLDPEKPPKTWDELLAYSKTIKEKTGLPGIGVPSKVGLEVLQEFYAQFITQSTERDMLDENNKPTFNNEKGLQALEYLGKLWPFIQPSPTEYGRGELRPLIRDGKLGMFLDSDWAVPTYTDKFGNNLDESPIGIAEPPLGPNKKPIAWAGTNGWVATRKSTAAASGKLISFLMSEEQLFNHHKTYGSVPILPYELKQPFFQYKYWNTFHRVMTTYKLIGMIGKYHPTPGAFYSQLEEVWQLYMFGKVDAKEAMNLAVRKIDEINARQGK
jgi:multiple sugar transport system substrate-binding protein